jgi:hypothetical protein
MVGSAWPPVSSRRFHFPVSASDMEYREPLSQIERPFQSRKPFGLRERIVTQKGPS